MLRKLTCWSACALLLMAVVSTDAVAQKKKTNNRKKAFLNAKDAGPDFQIQGEYVGEIPSDDGNKKIGIQVIALGDGKFDAVGYQGGLPGAGWNGEEKIKGTGKTENGVTTLKGKHGTATIEKGVLTITNTDGQIVAKLKKTLRKSDTLGKKAPKNAVVLFDGTTAKHFKGGKLTKDGLLEQGVTSHQKFQSFHLHLEFKTPFMPFARGQGRGNSGLYMQGRFETQILDSFGLEGKQNECGGVYSISDPKLNMCLPPLSWQTYDVDFTAAKFDATGKKTADAKMTVHINGTLIHQDLALPRRTTAAPVKTGPEPGPIYLQNHGNPIRFRNIWLVEKK